MKQSKYSILLFFIGVFAFLFDANAQNSAILNCSNNIDDLSIEIVNESIPLQNRTKFNLFCPVFNPGNGYDYDHQLDIDTAKLFIHAEDSCGIVTEPVGIKIDPNSQIVFGYLDINITNSIEIEELEISAGIIRNDSTINTSICIKKVKMDVTVYQQDSLNNPVISNTYIETAY